MLQGGPSYAALKELESLVALIVWKSIAKKRDAGFIQNAYARHVHLPLARVAEIKREEVQVIVDTPGVAVVFDIALDDQRVPCIEHRPRWSGEADAARI